MTDEAQLKMASARLNWLEQNPAYSLRFFVVLPPCFRWNRAVKIAFKAMSKETE